MVRAVLTTLGRYLLLATCTAVSGCAGPSQIALDADEASNGDLWRQKGGLTAEITVTPAEGEAFRGNLLHDATTRRTVIQQLTNGALEEVGYTDQRVWTRYVPVQESSTWTQAMLFACFLSAPFELRGPGTTVRELYPMRMGAASYRVGLITRPSDDGKWAVCLNQSDRHVRAFIPLARKARQTGNYRGEAAIPLIKGYAVVYDEISKVEGVALPTRWLVWNWDSRRGVTGGPVAVVTLTAPKFNNPDLPGFVRGQSFNEMYLNTRWWR